MFYKNANASRRIETLPEQIPAFIKRRPPHRNNLRMVTVGSLMGIEIGFFLIVVYIRMGRIQVED